jgi:hypothetical protein
MRKPFITLIAILLLSITAHAQNYLGAGVSTEIAANRTTSGPHIEAQAIAGRNKLGTFTAHGLILPGPGVRLGLDFAPRGFRHETFRPFVGFGSEWTNGTRRDITHTTLSAGVVCKHLRLRATGLFGERDGFRAGADYLLPIKKHIAFHAAVEGTWNERGADYASLRFGFVRRF